MSTYRVGEVVWAKLKGYPLWPCIIQDPFLATDSKPKRKNIYHVRFLDADNRAQVAWVGMADVLDFVQNLPTMRSTAESKGGMGKVYRHLLKCIVIGEEEHRNWVKLLAEHPEVVARYGISPPRQYVTVINDGSNQTQDTGSSDTRKQVLPAVAVVQRPAKHNAGVGDPSDALESVEVEPQPAKPTVDMGKMKDITVKASQTFEIRVPYHGCPQPVAEWIRVNVFGTPKDISNADSRVMTKMTPDATILSIGPAERSDTGVYKLTLRNGLGQDTDSVRVTVIDKPAMPEQLHADDVDVDNITLTWSAPRDSGGDIVTNYVLEKRGLDGVWTLVSDSVASTTFKIGSLQEGKPYDFCLMAENSAGRSEPCLTKDPITPRSKAENAVFSSGRDHHSQLAQSGDESPCAEDGLDDIDRAMDDWHTKNLENKPVERGRERPVMADCCQMMLEDITALGIEGVPVFSISWNSNGLAARVASSRERSFTEDLRGTYAVMGKLCLSKLYLTSAAEKRMAEFRKAHNIKSGKEKRKAKNDKKSKKVRND